MTDDKTSKKRKDKSPYADPTWEPSVVWMLPELQNAWERDLMDEDEVNEIPDLDPLPSEQKYGIRLTYAQYGTALGAHMTLDEWNEYPMEAVVVAMSLRRLGYDPKFGVREWALWKKNRPDVAPQVAEL